MSPGPQGPVRIRMMDDAPFSDKVLGIDVNEGVIGDSDGGYTKTNGRPKHAGKMLLRMPAVAPSASAAVGQGCRKAACGFQHMLIEELGENVIRIPAAYTSQACSACGHTERRNRPKRRTFKCQACGHEAHADVNAARNIAARAEQAQVVGGVR